MFLFETRTWDYLLMLIAIVINILILGTVGLKSGDNGAYSSIPTGVYITIRALGALMIFVSLSQFTTYCFHHRFSFIRRCLKPFTPAGVSYSLLSNAQRKGALKEALKAEDGAAVGRWNKFKVFIKMIYLLFKSFVTDGRATLSLFNIIFAVLGIYSPYFFAFHIIQVASESAHLKTIAVAVRSSFTTLILIFLLIIALLYVFSIVSYVGLSEHFTNLDTGLACDSILNCFASNLYAGVPAAGNMNQHVAPPTIPTEPSESWFLILYVVVFYVVIGLLMLNIFLAIIVDTFSELRDIREQARVARNNSCFVCSIEREAFKRRGIEFNNHVISEHNTWHYFYFFVYLRDQIGNKAELTHLESYVKQKIEDNRFLEIFPIERALSLETIQNSFDVASKMRDLEQASNNSFEQQEKILRENAELKMAMSRMTAQVSQLINAGTENHT
eukprot:TRINITY_DN4754_c0_g1_i2.p1 TRINITY_DN4754_c0_g1~~TRINITY_DN4754_c0_g1_i2.p1  ORF type:complete len:444 (-),score=122.98 TRINITY_DN4754_c0_g1_i2:24-1355(-)